MADEPTQAPVEEQDTPTPDAQDTSVETPETPDTDAAEQADTDYETRYQEAQAWGTRASQEAAQYRQIIDLARQGDPEALEYLGYEAPETDTEDDGYEDDEPITKAQFQEYLATQERDREVAESEHAFLTDFQADLSEIEKKEGRSLTDWEKEVLFNDAQGQVAETQTYDLGDPWKQITEYNKSVVERYVKSKQQAPAAPIGSAGELKIDPSDDDARQEALAQIMDAESQRGA